ncbi:hypothetical protein LSH36_750g01027 [Paralvinella palmiformis]|uniref:Uncharacterized protein n=1 Tax=Paralvinella palmiformis TaxID=53620 RepID=A0AAD9J1W7_9ANNE|nr:hypothetical protein LSH36_750g01027 [Paralvinella palmiformis]
MWKKTEHHPWAEAERAAVKTLSSKKIKSQKIPDLSGSFRIAGALNYAKISNQLTPLSNRRARLTSGYPVYRTYANFSDRPIAAVQPPTIRIIRD